jgi:hypothetical protein
VTRGGIGRRWFGLEPFQVGAEVEAHLPYQNGEVVQLIALIPPGIDGDDERQTAPDQLVERFWWDSGIGADGRPGRYPPELSSQSESLGRMMIIA